MKYYGEPINLPDGAVAMVVNAEGWDVTAPRPLPRSRSATWSACGAHSSLPDCPAASVNAAGDGGCPRFAVTIGKPLKSRHQ